MTLSRVLFLVDCETSAPEKKFTEKPFGTIVNYFASRPLTPLGTPRATCRPYIRDGDRSRVGPNRHRAVGRPSRRSHPRAPHFMVATYAITNARRYALKQEIKPSDDVEDEETSLTL